MCAWVARYLASATIRGGLRSDPMKRLRHAGVVGEELAVGFDDGGEFFIPLAKLRERCPCAACSGAHGPAQPAVISSQSDRRISTLRSIQPVGSYALQLRWQDGHEAGIYSFDYLAQLAT